MPNLAEVIAALTGGGAAYLEEEEAIKKRAKREKQDDRLIQIRENQETRAQQAFDTEREGGLSAGVSQFLVDQGIGDVSRLEGETTTPEPGSPEVAAEVVDIFVDERGQIRTDVDDFIKAQEDIFGESRDEKAMVAGAVQKAGSARAGEQRALEQASKARRREVGEFQFGLDPDDPNFPEQLRADITEQIKRAEELQELSAQVMRTRISLTQFNLREAKRKREEEEEARARDTDAAARQLIGREFNSQLDLEGIKATDLKPAEIRQRWLNAIEDVRELMVASDRIEGSYRLQLVGYESIESLLAAFENPESSRDRALKKKMSKIFGDLYGKFDARTPEEELFGMLSRPATGR